MSRHDEYHNTRNNFDWDINGRANRRARTGKHRVVAEDRKYYGDDYVIAEYGTLTEAITCADAHSEPDHPHFVYNERKQVVHSSEGFPPFYFDEYGRNWINPPDPRPV